MISCKQQIHRKMETDSATTHMFNFVSNSHRSHKPLQCFVTRAGKNWRSSGNIGAPPATVPILKVKSQKKVGALEITFHSTALPDTAGVAPPTLHTTITRNDTIICSHRCDTITYHLPCFASNPIKLKRK